MKRNRLSIALFVMIMAVAFTACSEDEAYVLKQQDIQVDVPSEGFSVQVGQLLKVLVNNISDEGVTYQWILDDEPIATTKNLEYMMEVAGEYKLTLIATQYTNSFSYDFKVMVGFGEITPPSENATAYITQVFDFMPAVGQFTNSLPKYEEGDTQESMNQKVLAAIGNNNKGMISLGGFGGYVTVGFDHTIENRPGLRDFRVLANAFYSAANPNPDAPVGGSCEPGIIMVAYDKNKNGQPDEDEWYEIAGSAHNNPTGEAWYTMAKENGNDVNLYTDYEITYYRPEKEPETAKEKTQYIRWEDNKGNFGYKVKNAFHNQPYFPQWIKENKLTFRGTCLPQNGIDESGQGSYYVLYKFHYGYADNETNANEESAIDIDWAVNSKGQKVHLPGIDFVKIYTGVNQENGWLGECSTEITSVEDLHILGEELATRK